MCIFFLELETYCVKDALNYRSKEQVTQQEEEDGRYGSRVVSPKKG